MQAQQAFQQAQATDQIAALTYAPGYTAYIREDESEGGLYINFCKGEMPPHAVETFDTLDQLVSYLGANGWLMNWRVEEAE